MRLGFSWRRPGKYRFHCRHRSSQPHPRAHRRHDPSVRLCQASTGERTVAHIRHLNDLLKELCRQHNYEYLDYYTPLANEEGRMRQEFTTDGVHLNDQGYSRIAPVVIRSLNHGM